MSDRPSLPQYPQGQQYPQPGSEQYPPPGQPYQYPQPGGQQYPPPGGPQYPPPGQQYQYPGGGQYGGMGQAPPKPTKPVFIERAVQLMYVGAGLSVLSLVLGVAQNGSIKTQLQNQNPTYDASKINSLVAATIAVLIVGALIGVGLWVMNAIAVSKGHSWGRIVGTVFWGIATLVTLVNLAQTTASGVKVVSVLEWLVGLVIVVLLWRKPSSDFFTDSAAYRQAGGQ